MIKHTIARHGDKLRVTIDIDLAPVLDAVPQAPKRLGVQRWIARYLTRIPDDVLDLAEVFVNEDEIGVVKFFLEEKGWGFITMADQVDVFVHHKHIVGDGFKTLVPGQRVRFKQRFTRRAGSEVIEAVDVQVLEPTNAG